MKFLPKKKQDIIYKKNRFLEEFGVDEDWELPVNKPSNPLQFLTHTTHAFSLSFAGDFEYFFGGNTEDCFKIGISFTTKMMKLFTNPLTSDIIIASPLGLKLASNADPRKGAKGRSKNEGLDFLSSIEVVVVDHAESLLMGNWEWVQWVWKSIGRIPQDPKNLGDVGRVRFQFLNGHGQYYRQNLIFSMGINPDLNALWRSSKSILNLKRKGEKTSR